MVKVISLSDNAYNKLKLLKKNRSFSEIVVELVECNKKRNIMDFAGAFSNNSEEWTKIEQKIYHDRKEAKLRNYKI